MADGENSRFCFAVLGDLHLEPAQMDNFHDARSQILQHLTEVAQTAPGTEVRLFQLGDLGGYTNYPGSRACFETAKEFLSPFPKSGIPVQLVLGNHDLEGHEFDTDAENLAAWEKAFGQRHYWKLEMGSTVCIGLSTVRFRDAVDSNHEVHIDDEQLAWFEKTLSEYRDRPVFVFTHAPPMGSGLTSLLEVHVRNRCAWLNHSDRPQRFLEVVRRNPQIRLWFSGHYHLSHDYEGSVSSVGNCLFVQTGVIGNCNRDGRRHSRIVRGGAEGYEVLTLDHATGTLREDAEKRYNENGSPRRLWCSTLQAAKFCAKGGLFSPSMPRPISETCDIFNNTAVSVLPLSPAKLSYVTPATELATSPADATATWVQSGDLVLALCNNRLVQYDAATRAPLGVVCDAVNGREVRFVTAGSAEDGVSEGVEAGGGGFVEAIELFWPHSLLPDADNGTTSTRGEGGEETEWDASGEPEDYRYSNAKGAYSHVDARVERIERNELGGFWQVYQHNRWLIKRMKLIEAERLEADAAAKAGSKSKSGDSTTAALAAA